MRTKPKIHVDSFEEYRISVLRRIEWMLHRHFKNPKKITTKDIKKKQLELNAYENFKHLELAKEKQIIVLDDDKIGTSPAEKAILEGKFFWEHTAAGEATRLGLGTKYLLNLNHFSPEDIARHIREEAAQELEKSGLKGKKLAKEKKKISKEVTRKNVLEMSGGDPRKLLNISLGNRHMLQMAFDVARIAKENKKNPKKVLAKQSALIILNEQTAEEILEEFRRFNFFGLDPRKILFMVQRSFHGMYIKEGSLFYDQTTEKNKRLHNHGQMVMQKAHDNVIFRVDPKNTSRRFFLSSREFEEILAGHGDFLSYNIEDLGYLTCAVDLPSLALALELGKKGYHMVMEIVAQNPLKPQKGGACFFDRKLKRLVMVETNQLKNIKNEDIKHLNKNFNHYPCPVEAWRAIKRRGLPISFEVKSGFNQSGDPEDYVYACPVQGDTNFLVKTAYIMRKNLKPIYNWKSPATTPLAVKAMFEQEAQGGFKEFLRDIRKGKLKNY
ncbi:MAG: hypothetical protein A3J76_05485 [Candidatus Moranbacteria bacterium RBG_13_45_13]|nr:MAG: hypothetical protein A3J76_05485 [Candidatus Moranbacteria bacterium RBG_13_45_13]